MEETKYLIWLAMIFGSASRAVWEVIETYDTAYQAYAEITGGSCPIPMTINQKNNIDKISPEKAEEIISYCASNNINIITYNSPDYPEELKDISCPPPVLYCKGNISCIKNGKNVTCVGTRKPSNYTQKIISGICTELAVNNFTIVSGFAVGCDITAHMSAVKNSGKTACILGCGLDINYPSQNQQYRKSIIENGGVFISEFPPETPAFARNFPQRNRILSALSKATIVFEATEKSGSLNTASLVCRQHKKLFCIPPADILDSRYAGNIHLLRTCAEPLYSVDDILDIYGFTENKPEIRYKPEKNKYHINDIPKKNETKFTSVQQKILSIFNDEPMHIDTIIDRLNMDISEIIAEIMDLQMSGVIEEITGNRYRKTERGNR